MSAPIRTLGELVDVVQELIDQTGKHVYAEDLQEALDRVGASVDSRDALVVAVRALDPAAADDQTRGNWDAAKWAVFNAAVRFVKEQEAL